MTPTPSIVNLPCGCFFRGREMVADGACPDHCGDDDDEGIQEDFTFAELSPRAKDRARDEYRENGIDPGWWDSVYAEADEIASAIGIEIGQKRAETYGGAIVTEPRIWFDGFYSQGDGACFEGDWSPARYPLSALNAVIDLAPQDTQLHEIAFSFAHMSERCNALIPDASAHIEHSGHGHHSGCTRIDVELPTSPNVDEENELQLMVWNALVEKHGLVYESFEKELTTALRAFMDWIYRRLEEEHDYLTCDETADAALADLKFDEDGDWLP